MNNTNNHDLKITAFSTDQAQIPLTFLWNYFFFKCDFLSRKQITFKQKEEKEFYWINIMNSPASR